MMAVSVMNSLSTSAYTSDSDDEAFVDKDVVSEEETPDEESAESPAYATSRKTSSTRTAANNNTTTTANISSGTLTKKNSRSKTPPNVSGKSVASSGDESVLKSSHKRSSGKGLGTARRSNSRGGSKSLRKCRSSDDILTTKTTSKNDPLAMPSARSTIKTRTKSTHVRSSMTGASTTTPVRSKSMRRSRSVNAMPQVRGGDEIPSSKKDRPKRRSDKTSLLARAKAGKQRSASDGDLDKSETMEDGDAPNNDSGNYDWKAGLPKSSRRNDRNRNTKQSVAVRRSTSVADLDKSETDEATSDSSNDQKLKADSRSGRRTNKKSPVSHSAFNGALDKRAPMIRSTSFGALDMTKKDESETDEDPADSDDQKLKGAPRSNRLANKLSPMGRCTSIGVLDMKKMDDSETDEAPSGDNQKIKRTTKPVRRKNSSNKKSPTSRSPMSRATSHRALQHRKGGSDTVEPPSSDDKKVKRVTRSGRRVDRHSSNKKSSVRRSASDGNLDRSEAIESDAEGGDSSRRGARSKASLVRSASGGDMDSSEILQRALAEVSVAPTRRGPRRSSSMMTGKSYNVGSCQILQALKKKEEGWDNDSRDRGGTAGGDWRTEHKIAPPRRSGSHCILRETNGPGGLRTAPSNGKIAEKTQRRQRTSSAVRERMEASAPIGRCHQGEKSQRPRRSRSGLHNAHSSAELRPSSNHGRPVEPRKRRSGRDLGSRIKASSSHGGTLNEPTMKPRRRKSVDPSSGPQDNHMPLKRPSSHAALMDHSSHSRRSSRRPSGTTDRLAGRNLKAPSTHEIKGDFATNEDAHIRPTAADEMEEDSSVQSAIGFTETSTTTPPAVAKKGGTSATATTTTTSSMFSRLMAGSSTTTTGNNEKATSLLRTFSSDIGVKKRPSISKSILSLASAPPPPSKDTADGAVGNNSNNNNSNNNKSMIVGPMAKGGATRRKVKSKALSKDDAGQGDAVSRLASMPQKKEFTDLDDSCATMDASGYII